MQVATRTFNILMSALLSMLMSYPTHSHKNRNVIYFINKRKKKKEAHTEVEEALQQSTEAPQKY